MEMLRQWWGQPGNRQIAVLLIFLALAAAILYFLGAQVAPALTALIIAYVLDGPTNRLESLGLSRLWATVCIWLLTLIALIIGVGTLVPAISGEIVQISPAISTAVEGMREPFFTYAENNAWLIGPEIAQEMFNNTSGVLDQIVGSTGGLTNAFDQLGGVLSGALDLVIYTVIVPLMTFFFFKGSRFDIGVLRALYPNGKPVVRTSLATHQYLYFRLYSRQVARNRFAGRGDLYRVFITGVKMGADHCHFNRPIAYHSHFWRRVGRVDNDPFDLC